MSPHLEGKEIWVTAGNNLRYKKSYGCRLSYIAKKRLGVQSQSQGFLVVLGQWLKLDRFLEQWHWVEIETFFQQGNSAKLTFMSVNPKIRSKCQKLNSWVVFGGKSTKTRNTQMIKLAELGFGKLQQ